LRGSRYDYESPVGGKRGNERSRLDIGVTGANEQPGDFGVGVGDPCEIDDEHVGKEHESHGAEVTTIDMSHKSLGRVVVLAPDHLPNAHDGNVPTPAVLQKLVIVNAPVVIDNIGGLAIFAHDDVRRISERPSV
jgi:hypothetical protein